MSVQIIIPGNVLGTTKENKAGVGAYSSKSEIRASIVGKVVTEKDKSETFSSSSRPRINVIPVDTRPSAKSYVLNVGDIVYARVIRMNYNQAYLDILCIGDFELPVPLKAVIRREDIRETEVDKVVVSEFFQAFDIVRASVISLGDSKYYFLSTAKDGLGVVLPKSKDKFI